MLSSLKLKVKSLQAKSFAEKSDYDLFERPAYAYCILKAAELGKRLNLESVSVAEFGVAGGNGLLALQDYAAQVSGEIGINIKVIGFDTGSGMPKAEDPRDLEYLWFENDFDMDVSALKERLSAETELILGDVSETIQNAAGIFKTHPLGAALFDVDYYSSTMSALKVFALEPHCYLPRVLCFFDNVIGRAEFPINEHVAELAAIRDFNEMHKTQKIGKINYFHHKRMIPASWNDKMYVFQDFQHPLYKTPVRERRSEKTSLRSL